jgi:primosomal protein N' (replication factor Y)
VVRVLPDVPALRREFDYAVPAGVADDVRMGTQVRVALHGRRVGGWIVADDVVPPSGVALQPLLSVRGWGPPPAVLDLARWAAWRWAGPVASFLRTASAPRAVRALPSVPGRWSSGDRSVGGTARGDDFAAGALAGGVTVVRLAPASDAMPICDAAAAMLARASDVGVLILAPSHGAVGAIADHLRRSGAEVAVLPDDWAVARAGGCVAVGTRAGAFAPLPRLGAVVVIDAHDEAYHEERAPTWHAWGVAVERARRDGAPCALVSPCPPLDLLAVGRLLTTSRAAERRGWPVVEVVDRRRDDPRTGLFSTRLVRSVRWATAAEGRRLVCVVNRTGRARLLVCAACGDMARCERCGGPLELVDGDASSESLRCRRCGQHRPVVCAACGATTLKARRLGVTRVREELEALAGSPVAEIWGPPDRSQRDAQRVEAPPVVVGTEAALHRVTRADEVAFLDFDVELMAPRFRAAEQALALLARAARLVSVGDGAGTHRAHGRVLVQTRQPRNPVLMAAVAADPGVLDAAELGIRQELGLPPCRAMAVLSGATADAYGVALQAEAAPGIEVRGPVDGIWSVRAPDHRALAGVLASVPRPAGRLRVEVDPFRV